MWKNTLKFSSACIIVVFCSFLGTYLAMAHFSKQYKGTHAFLVVQQSDADYIRQETQRKIWGK